LTIWRSWKIFEVASEHPRVMETMRNRSSRDVADLVAYYARLSGVCGSAGQTGIFPQARPDPSHAGNGIASGFVWRWRAWDSTVPVVSRSGGGIGREFPSLANQNGEYVFEPARGVLRAGRAPMISTCRCGTISSLLTEDERQALADIMGRAGMQPGSSSGAR